MVMNRHRSGTAPRNKPCCKTINPFATTRTRPGKIAYRFPVEISNTTIADRLESHDWRGQIVGPHGTGKSTLLYGLLPELRRRGRRIESASMRAGERQLPWRRSDVRLWSPETQIVIDGYEQVWVTGRMWLKLHCRRSGAGLLVTTHHSVNLPDIWRTSAPVELAWELVQELLAGYPSLITRDDVAAAMQIHRGNVREVLFEMYDLFAERAG